MHLLYMCAQTNLFSLTAGPDQNKTQKHRQAGSCTSLQLAHEGHRLEESIIVAVNTLLFLVFNKKKSHMFSSRSHCHFDGPPYRKA